MKSYAGMKMKQIAQAVVLTALLTVAGQAGAATFDLCAGTTTKTMPDGNAIILWGYGLDTGTPCAVTVPGPQLVVPVGDNTLTVNLRNELAEAVSIVISGQRAVMTPVFVNDAQGRPRVRSFTHETPPTTGGVYTWSNLKPGTYLYSSGTRPAVQVQMGLYGSITHDAVNGQAYAGIAYDNEVTLLYSEIDPALHAAVAGNDYGPGKGTTSTINYAPKYFLVNGAPYVPGDLPLSAGTAGESTLIRFLNAGLESHALVVQGQHVKLMAEDGNVYPWPREQYGVLMAAGKTKDAVFIPGAAGTYPVYDRRLRSGMLTNLSVAAAVPGPTAVNDSATVAEDSSTNRISVLANDTQAPSSKPIDVATVAIGAPAVNGQATANSDGSVIYTANPDFNGSDSFTYTVRDTAGNKSKAATVSVTVTAVNDAPVAFDDAFSIEQDSSNNTLNVPANDTDIDGDTLTITALGPADNGGTLTTDGSTVSYSPAAGFTGIETFTYDIADGNGGSASATVTITITLTAPAENQPPEANDDYATVTANVGTSTYSVTINVAANDTDADGTVDAATVIITGNPLKGEAVSNGDGSVTYTPTAGELGSDAFGYTVNDDLGATSNEATVRVDILN